jgi:hypothetical protein
LEDAPILFAFKDGPHQHYFVVTQQARVLVFPDKLDYLSTFGSSIDQVSQKVHLVTVARSNFCQQIHQSIIVAMDIANNNAAVLGSFGEKVEHGYDGRLDARGGGRDAACGR